MAVLAPMPKASERTATATKTGDFLNVREGEAQVVREITHTGVILARRQNVTGAAFENQKEYTP
jgi:hypothetical protein